MSANARMFYRTNPVVQRDDINCDVYAIHPQVAIFNPIADCRVMDGQ